MKKRMSDSPRRAREKQASTPDIGATAHGAPTANPSTPSSGKAAFLDAILEHAPSGFGLLDLEFRFVEVNTRLAEINGRPIEDHIGRTVSEILGPVMWKTRRALLEKALTGETTVDAALPGRQLDDGGQRQIVSTYIPVHHEGKVIGVAVIVRDVTEFTQTQTALKRQSLAFENLFDALVITDITGVIIDCNASFLRRTGLPREALIGQPIALLARPEDRERLVPSIIETLRAEGRFTGEVHYVNSSGEVRIAEISVVPFRDGRGGMTGMVAALRDTTDRKIWELTLRESEERYRHTAEELAAAYDRERAIASQLQDSLHPHFPTYIPGLSIDHYYRPALDEAEVGGDFADCFPLDGQVTAIAVGDLSGKGLAAAVQVGTVRNMLRYAIYNGSTLSESVSKLNKTLSEFNLLVGFATLFAATFDANNGELNYINCGQEPALVYHAATGEVEELAPTGPVLGSFEHFDLIQETVPLSSGDVLAIFTDGLTEVGARRGELLGVGGVAEILSANALSDSGSTQPADVLVRRLVQEVNKRVKGRLRDDICLLVAVVR